MEVKKLTKFHKMMNNIVYKQCRDCNEWFPCNEDFYYKNKGNGNDGLNTYCKSCTSKRNTKWQKDNPDKKKVYYTKWNHKPESKKKIKESNARRMVDGRMLDYQRRNKDKLKLYRDNRKEHHHQISNKEWESCKEYFNHECAYCGMSEEDHRKIYKQQLHKEHVIHEGRNDLKNCVPSCKECNSKKNIFSFNSWYNEDNPKYSRERYLKIYHWIRFDCLKYIQKKSKHKLKNNSK